MFEVTKSAMSKKQGRGEEKEETVQSFDGLEPSFPIIIENRRKAVGRKYHYM